MNKNPEFDFHKPFLVSLLVIVVFVFGFGVMGKTQKNVNQNGAAVALSKTTTTAGPPNPGQTVAQKVFLMGGVSHNSGTLHNVLSSINGTTWNIIQPNASWIERYANESVYYNNKIWLIGGIIAGGASVEDVWSSVDGISWTNMTNHILAWSTNRLFSATVFNGKIWITGGTNGSSSYNDAWSSSDGVNWTTSAALPWAGRARHDSVVFNNKLWIFGGDGNFTVFSDVWSSPDGVNWTQVTSNAPWGPRTFIKATVFNNKIWIMGGQNGSVQYQDVWSSPDGVNWTQVVAVAPMFILNGRQQFDLFVLNNKIWLAGGINGLGSMFNDTWSSADGISWIQGTNNLSVSNGGISGHSIVVTPATFGLPDLTITNLTFRNQPIHVSTTNPYVYYDVTVKNSSTIPVVLPATGNTFQINLTSIPSAVPSGDLATITVGTPITLQPGQSHTFSNVSTRYDSRIRATARTYRITAKADALNLITELNETNNTYATNLTIIP
jgi:hypothetical protein